MDHEAERELEPTAEVELVSDGENLLVVGAERRSVEAFLRAKGLLDKARELGRGQLVPALRSSADALRTVSDAVAQSSLWLKVTPESAEAIKEFGLTDSSVPGVAYAMAGTRGDIRKWIKVDTTARAQVANPGVLSGAAGALSQAARQQEAAQLRELLESLDKKLDQVIRGQKDEILGDLAGIERQIRATRRRLGAEGGMDALTWTTLFGTSLGLRQVQEKALLKLQGVAEDLETQKRFGDLRRRVQEATGEVQLWLSAVARCVTALDELAVMELDYLAELEPHRLDARRQTLDAERQDDRIQLDEGIAVLLHRMDEAARTANQNKLLHSRGVSKALDSIESARDIIRRVYNALGVEVDCDPVDPVQWREALLQLQQWRNGLQEGGSLALEKGKPVVVPLLATMFVTAVGAVVKRRIGPPGGSNA